MTQIKQLLKLSLLLICCGFLASCDNEDGLTNLNGTPLPDGEFPLMITATMEGELTTRAAGKDTWTLGDVIGARIGTGTAGSYEITDAATGALTATAPAYWQSTAPATVTAWYPAAAQNNVDISDQSGGFAQFDFLKAEVPNSTYSQANIALPFEHQMAKVKVTVSSANTYTDLTGAEVRILGRPSLNYSDGTVTSSAANAYIIAQPDGVNIYEALLVPQQMAVGDKFISVKLSNGRETFYTITTATDADLQANKVHEYAIDVDGIVYIDPSQPIPTLTDEGAYIIDGTGKGQTTNPITIDGNPTVILKDVDLKAGTAVSIIGGSPRLIIEGTTKLESTGAGNGVISSSNGAGIDISGNGTLNLKSVVGYSTGFLQPFFAGAIIGSASGSSGGDINISDVTINIVDIVPHAAGIGSGNNSSCGDIIIENATINIATAVGGAGIGTSYANGSCQSICGDIQIKNSDIEITYENFGAVQGAAIGCGAQNYNGSAAVKGIYITLKAGQTRDQFLSKLNTTIAMNPNKIGYSFVEVGSGSGPRGTVTNGIRWYDSNGTPVP